MGLFDKVGQLTELLAMLDDPDKRELVIAAVMKPVQELKAEVAIVKRNQMLTMNILAQVYPDAVLRAHALMLELNPPPDAAANEVHANGS